MSSIANLINLSMGFESEEVDTLETPVDELEVMEDTAEQVEEEAELQEAEQGVENVEEATAQLEEAEEALESLYQQLQYDIEHNGGVSQEAYPYVQIACASALRKIGAESLVTLPSTESFGGASTRLQSTQIAMESVGESLKKIWDAIVSMIARARDAIVNFFKSVFTKIGRVKSAAEKLKKKAAEAKESGSLKVKVSAKVANMLGASSGEEGNVNVVETINGIVKHLPQFRQADERLDQIAAKASDLVDNVIKKGENVSEDVATSLINDIEKHYKEGVYNKEEVVIGGATFKFEKVEKKFYQQIAVLLNPVVQVQDTVKDAYTITNLTVNDVSKIASSVLSVVNEIEKVNSSVKKMESDSKRLKGMRFAESELTNAGKELLKFYQVVEQWRGKTFAKFSSASLNVINAGLTVGYKALKLKPEGASESAQKNETKLLPAS